MGYLKLTALLDSCSDEADQCDYVAFLNDLFGIQARGGCACAGPLMQSLLGLNRELVRNYEAVLAEDERLDRVGLRRQGEHSQWEVVRPGATRLNLPWVSTEEEVEFILSALELVAAEGWKLLPVYRFNNETGEWRVLRSDTSLLNVSTLGVSNVTK